MGLADPNNITVQRFTVEDCASSFFFFNTVNQVQADLQ